MTKRTLFRCFGIVSLFLPVSLLAQKDAASLEGARARVLIRPTSTARSIACRATYLRTMPHRKIAGCPT